MRLFVLIHKNTSPLDFILPALQEFAKTQSTFQVTILYCCINKKSILRDTQFFSRICAQYGAQEMDYADASEHFLLKVLKPLFAFSSSEAPSFNEVKKTKDLGEVFHFVTSKILRFLEKFLSFVCFNLTSYLIDSKPDQILLENRAKSTFPLHEQLDQFIQTQKTPVVFLPHAPHYIDETQGYAPLAFGDLGLPTSCRFWIPFLPSRPWRDKPSIQDRSIYVGYPGFDSQWIERCQTGGSDISGTKVLFIGRKIFAKGVHRWNKGDYVTLEYQEVLETLCNIHQSVFEVVPQFHLIFKAHPSSRRHLIEQVLKEAGFNNFSITYEPFYAILNGVRLVISNYSTSVLIPTFMQTPVVLIDSDLQRFINTHWDLVKKMYEDFEFFARDANQTRSHIQKILREGLTAKNDVRRLRDFFPDGASKRIVQDLISWSAGKE